ncbi:MAG: sulfite reductase subunit alpha [Pseudomonadota bacterium]
MMDAIAPARLLWLTVLLTAYAALCLLTWRRWRRQRQGPPSATPADWIVAYASQTGQAEELARHTAASLALAGITVRLCELGQVTAADLAAAERMLFVVSTYGEGDPPDQAAAFLAGPMAAGVPLTGLHYAVLALGDRGYAQFCGFGRALDQWLAGQGAARLFDAIEVDRGAAAAIDRWRLGLSHLAGTSDAPDWSAPPFAPWRLCERRLINADSAGAPLYHLEFEPVQAALPDWRAGDLAQIAAPADPDHPREYSVASIPADGRLHLLVRLHRHADGGVGVASGWLALQAPIGAPIALRLRAHRRFRLEGNAARPLILIGNGSGMAGLRGHLRARAASGQHGNWLLFGERQAAHDFHYRPEIEAWREAGLLTRVDVVFSRDQPARLYVQDRLAAEAEEVRRWLARGAAIYVCGSLEGMAGGVDRTLEQIIGRARLDALAAQGRYRRDVY